VRPPPALLGGDAVRPPPATALLGGDVVRPPPAALRGGDAVRPPPALQGGDVVRPPAPWPAVIIMVVMCAMWSSLRVNEL